MNKIKYDPNYLSSFDEEWGVHTGCKDWWTAHAMMFDEDGNLFVWQYSLLYFSSLVSVNKLGIVSLMDFADKKTYYQRTSTNKDVSIYVDEFEVSIGTFASAKKEPDGIHFQLMHPNFTLDVLTEYGKGRVWNCDDGKIQMGIEGERNTSISYSWPNMPAKGVMMLNGVEHILTGRVWFDKQSGPFPIDNPKTHWERFNIFFMDDKEVMLFTFPESLDPMFDGTYIADNGKSERLNQYTIERTGTEIINDFVYSSGWNLYLDDLDLQCSIEPMPGMDICELVDEKFCVVKDTQGKIIGFAFAELLPGVLNKSALASGGMKHLLKQLKNDIIVNGGKDDTGV